MKIKIQIKIKIKIRIREMAEFGGRWEELVNVKVNG